MKRISITREVNRAPGVMVDGQYFGGVTNLKLDGNNVTFSAGGKDHSHTVTNWRLTGAGDGAEAATPARGAGAPSGAGTVTDGTATGASGTTR